MKDDQQLILTLLLDRYERSKQYSAPGESGRGIFLRFDRETLPEYWDETHWQRRGELNQAASSLEAVGLVRIKYARHSREEIARLDLRIEHLEAAYKQANRTPRRIQELALAAVASGWEEHWSGDWRQAFAQSVMAAVERFEKVPAGFKPGESDLIGDVCRVIDRLGPKGLPAELPRRLFSQRVLGSSKRLEAIQSRVLRVLREFWPVPLPEDDSEALAEVGILENPRQVLVAGPVTLDTLPIGVVGDAVGLPSSFIERCRVTELDADRVVTVENLTSFHEVVHHLPPRTLAVYLGGYHNRPRRELLLKLAGSKPLELYHWGDIDLGGFRIWAHLQARTGLFIRPLLMDRETYLAHQANGMDFGSAYGKEVESLLEQPDFAPFHDTIREMIRWSRRVEQESVDFRPIW